MKTRHGVLVCVYERAKENPDLVVPCIWPEFMHRKGYAFFFHSRNRVNESALRRCGNRFELSKGQGIICILQIGSLHVHPKSKDRLQQVWHDLTALFVDDRSIRDGRWIHHLQQCQYIVLHEASIKLVVSGRIVTTSSRKMKGFAGKT